MKRLMILITALLVLSGCTKEDPVRTAFPATVGKPRHGEESIKPKEPESPADTTGLKRGLNIIKL